MQDAGMCSGVSSFFVASKTSQHGRTDGFVKSGFTRIQRSPKLLICSRQRIGQPYISPPSRHCALTPRTSFIGLACPRLASKRSP